MSIKIARKFVVRVNGTKCPHPPSWVLHSPLSSQDSLNTHLSEAEKQKKIWQDRYHFGRLSESWLRPYDQQDHRSAVRALLIYNAETAEYSLYAMGYRELFHHTLYTLEGLGEYGEDDYLHGVLTVFTTQTGLYFTWHSIGQDLTTPEDLRLPMLEALGYTQR